MISANGKENRVKLAEYLVNGYGLDERKVLTAVRYPIIEEIGLNIEREEDDSYTVNVEYEEDAPAMVATESLATNSTVFKALGGLTGDNNTLELQAVEDDGSAPVVRFQLPAQIDWRIPKFRGSAELPTDSLAESEDYEIRDGEALIKYSDDKFNKAGFQIYVPSVAGLIYYISGQMEGQVFDTDTFIGAYNGSANSCYTGFVFYPVATEIITDERVFTETVSDRKKQNTVFYADAPPLSSGISRIVRIIETPSFISVRIVHNIDSREIKESSAPFFLRTSQLSNYIELDFLKETKSITSSTATSRSFGQIVEFDGFTDYPVTCEDTVTRAGTFDLTLTDINNKKVIRFFGSSSGVNFEAFRKDLKP